MNVTLDERGGAVKRLGLSKIAEVGAPTTVPQILFYSRVLDKLMIQISTGIYKSDDGGSTWSASLHTFTSGARVGMCDFLGKLVVIHPLDGVFTYNGTTFDAAKVANSPNGNTIAVWKNALWSAGDPSNVTRLTRSDLGAITWPASPLTNDFRVKDDTAITAVTAAGVDALLVYKEESAYRQQSITNDAYMMLSPTYGASGPLCVALNRGECAAISRRGISTTDGMQSLRLVSSKLEPLFRPDQLAYSTSADWCAGVHRDRFVFSLARTGQTVNDITLEYQPTQNWIVPHTGCAVQAYASYVMNTRKLLGGKIAATVKTAAFEVFKGGNDDGAAIASRFQTRWFEPGNGTLCRYRRVRVKGRGNFQVTSKLDYADQGRIDNFLPTSAGMVWGTGIWGQGLWGANDYESFYDLYSLGVGKAISFAFSETSSSSTVGPKLLGDGSAPEVGNFACYGLELDFIPLGGA